MKSSTVVSKIITVLCGAGIVANALAVQLHMLCSMDTDHGAAQYTVINDDQPGHEHQCTHTAHHEPAGEKGDDSQCTPCVNDFITFSGTPHSGKTLQLPVTATALSIHSQLPNTVHTSLPTDFRVRAHPVFPPQYPPLKTVLRS